MKKNIFLSLLSIILIFIITGCTNNGKVMENKRIDDYNIKESEKENNMETITNINVIINGKNYKTTLENNETAKNFVKLLPQEFTMKELNGNEKYIYMDNSLPTNPVNPKYIEAGDIMLYGNDCLVIFYKSFTTSYSYTKIGHIDNLSDLGNSNITAKFENIK